MTLGTHKASGSLFASHQARELSCDYTKARPARLGESISHRLNRVVCDWVNSSKMCAAPFVGVSLY
jgi:hypothetical protein